MCGGPGEVLELHDVLFADGRRRREVDFLGTAKRLGLRDDSFQTCLNGANREKIRGQQRRAEEFGLKSTPAFFVGSRTANGSVRVTHQVFGAQPLSAFAKVFEEILAVR